MNAALAQGHNPSVQSTSYPLSSGIEAQVFNASGKMKVFINATYDCNVFYDVKPYELELRLWYSDGLNYVEDELFLPFSEQFMLTTAMSTVWAQPSSHFLDVQVSSNIPYRLSHDKVVDYELVKLLETIEKKYWDVPYSCIDIGNQTTQLGFALPLHAYEFSNWMTETYDCVPKETHLDDSVSVTFPRHIVDTYYANPVPEQYDLRMFTQGTAIMKGLS